VPVVDVQRWWFFDYAENFNDVFFMSLMFFISGLFVWPSLRRSGVPRFLRDRLLRLGAPFAIGVVFLMPLAYYSSWQLVGRDVGYIAYWRQFITSAWSPGPLWFLWLLLFFDILAAAFFMAWFMLWPRWIGGVPVSLTKRRVLTSAAATFVLCGVVYLPGLRAFGPHAWGVFFIPPLYFQLSRIGLYLLWFAIGVWLGHENLEDGLLAGDGALARHWRWWIAGCVVAYNALMYLPGALAAAGAVTPFQRGLISALLWIASCVASSFAFLALFRGAVQKRRSWMDSLSRSAYVIYLVHYVFVLWLQRAMLEIDLGAAVKFSIVFLGACLFSWISAQCLLRVPFLRTVL
jgi:hypothetical protein